MLALSDIVTPVFSPTMAWTVRFLVPFHDVP